MAQKVYLLNEDEFNLFINHVKEVQQAHATYKDINFKLIKTEMDLQAAKQQYASVMCPVCVTPMSYHSIKQVHDKNGILWYLTNPNELKECTRHLYSVNSNSQWRFNGWLEPERENLRNHVDLLKAENKNLKALLKEQLDEN